MYSLLFLPLLTSLTTLTYTFIFQLVRQRCLTALSCIGSFREFYRDVIEVGTGERQLS
ncbi:hypothetical protein M438DRAFT_93080 [Aureobasidium pullulans EXF-150]|uniref:Uncharacterized protein n=1 Tax=Aureobasidium pullulans EXF-150 TaxID=1043002 RepID=A0A074YPP5_AURPU|nr:uncharacterized protein M438DRAFT_93080 [Aureobasidium pullulans EXF-150]KEQ88836.1 hypothetical protein M438DRAFT_93080 [Aureobasidium pullulans EXF-150]